MDLMSGGYWEQVLETGLEVPTDRPLQDLTADLTRMLGATDPAVRDGIAYPTLSTWVRNGVYDDLLSGLGDGMAAGLSVGLGDTGTDTVFRRSWSARVLCDCIARDNSRPLVAGGKVLDWGDRLATWLLRERDLRGWVPGSGAASALVHGADALATLARSPHLAAPELTVVLDVIADRVLAPEEMPLPIAVCDHLAVATVEVMRRNTVPLAVLEPWVARLASVAATRSAGPDRDPHLVRASPESFLRSLYLLLSLGTRPPEARADLLLVLVDALRATNGDLLSAPLDGQ